MWAARLGSPTQSTGLLLRKAAAAAVVLLLAFAWGARAQIANTTTLPKGWNAAKCPTFPTGACTFARCNLPNVGFLYKFRSFNLKRSTVKVGKTTTQVVNVTGGSPATIGATTLPVKTPSDCCVKCATTPQCVFWQWIPYLKKPCYLLTNKIDKSCDKPIATFGTSSAQRRRQVLIGGRCNAKAENDPHFVGARGTPFDFNGSPDHAFCLHTDRNLHINMLMRGYLDSNTQGATVLASGKAVRTWIKELGIMWRSAGVEHTLHLVARDGKQQERGHGFLAAAVLDGKPLPRLEVGSSHSAAGGLAFSLLGVEKSGPYDVDSYRLVIHGLLDLDLRMRVANKLLQSSTDAEAHFNLGFNDVKVTEAVHGVLGQTYREDHRARAVDFSALAAELHGPVVADGESGKGFLDGSPRHYQASSVLTPDCFFSAYTPPDNYISLYSQQEQA